MCAAVQVGDWKQSRGLKVREDEREGGGASFRIFAKASPATCTRIWFCSQEISFMSHSDVLIITMKLFWPWTDTRKHWELGYFWCHLPRFHHRLLNIIFQNWLHSPLGSAIWENVCCAVIPTRLVVYVPNFCHVYSLGNRCTHHHYC